MIASFCPRFLVFALVIAARELTVSAAPQPLAADYTTIYHNPDSEYYVEGSGLLRGDAGTLIAVVPVIPRGEWSEARRVDHCTTYIRSSRDGGKTWEALSTLPYYSCVPWALGTDLFVFAMKGGVKARNDDLLLLKSSDGGRTWSAPVTLRNGHFWNCHTGMVVRDRRLYWAVDDLSFGAKRGPMVVVGDLSMDPMQVSAWRFSNPVPLPDVPPQLVKASLRNLGNQYLEPNVIDEGSVAGSRHGEARAAVKCRPLRRPRFDGRWQGGAARLQSIQRDAWRAAQILRDLG